MKRCFLIICVLLSLLIFAACAQTDTASPPAAQPEPPASDEAPAADDSSAGEEKEDDSLTVEPEGDAAVVFSTTDIDGEAYDESIFSDYQLTMINFWEYWCSPCITELPELQKLSEDYADRGFRIIGVISDTSNMDRVRSIVAEAGIEYPVLFYTDSFDAYQTGYVPNTIFVDGSGQLVGDIHIGAKSYDDWAAIVDSLME